MKQTKTSKDEVREKRESGKEVREKRESKKEGKSRSIVIRCKNFMYHVSYENSFEDGLTIVSGENGSGKTSLLLAICYALCGSKSSPGRTLSSIGVKSKFEVNVSFNGIKIERRQRTLTATKGTEPPSYGDIAQHIVNTYLHSSPQVFMLAATYGLTDSLLDMPPGERMTVLQQLTFHDTHPTELLKQIRDLMKQQVSQKIGTEAVITNLSRSSTEVQSIPKHSSEYYEQKIENSEAYNAWSEYDHGIEEYQDRITRQIDLLNKQLDKLPNISDTLKDMSQRAENAKLLAKKYEVAHSHVLVEGRYGITCPSCNTDLRIVQGKKPREGTYSHSDMESAVYKQILEEYESLDMPDLEKLKQAKKTDQQRERIKEEIKDLKRKKKLSPVHLQEPNYPRPEGKQPNLLLLHKLAREAKEYETYSSKIQEIQREKTKLKELEERIEILTNLDKFVRMIVAQRLETILKKINAGTEKYLSQMGMRVGVEFAFTEKDKLGVTIKKDEISIPYGKHCLGKGELQRVNIAVMLSLAEIVEPPFLILDEPSNHQSPSSSVLMYKCLKHSSVIRPIIMVSHDKESHQYADHVYKL